MAAHAGHASRTPTARFLAGHGSGRAAGWSDAAGYTISDLTMLRKELVIGFVVAGFAEAAVPVSVLAVAVPHRARLLVGAGERRSSGRSWRSSASSARSATSRSPRRCGRAASAFGGTIAFVFADLITLPLLLIYRRYYGTRLTLKLLAVFWATMSAAGLATEYLFRAAGIAPAQYAGRDGVAGRDVWGWNYTTVLDIVAIVVLRRPVLAVPQPRPVRRRRRLRQGPGVRHAGPDRARPGHRPPRRRDRTTSAPTTASTGSPASRCGTPVSLARRWWPLTRCAG